MPPLVDAGPRAGAAGAARHGVPPPAGPRRGRWSGWCAAGGHPRHRHPRRRPRPGRGAQPGAGGRLPGHDPGGRRRLRPGRPVHRGRQRGRATSAAAAPSGCSAASSCSPRAVTAVLSLDATVVLLTPVVIGGAVGDGHLAAPGAYACLRMANSASLLLPVSNLTNLLAMPHLDLTFGGFALVMAPVLAVVLVVEYVVLRLLFRARPRRAAARSRRRHGAGRRSPRVPLVAVRADAGRLRRPVAVRRRAVLGLGGGRAGARRVGAAAAGCSTVREAVHAAHPSFALFVLALGVVVAALADGLPRRRRGRRAARTRTSYAALLLDRGDRDRAREPAHQPLGHPAASCRCSPRSAPRRAGRAARAEHRLRADLHRLAGEPAVAAQAGAAGGDPGCAASTGSRWSRPRSACSPRSTSSRSSPDSNFASAGDRCAISRICGMIAA